jgi:uncharacterized protein YceK
MRYLLPVFSFLTLLLSGCGGVNTFTTSAQSESTITVAAGWRQGFTRDNITVTITDSTPTVTTYLPGDSRIRAVTNMYPDPVSSLVVDLRIQDPGNVGDTINTYQTNDDDDWWQTLVILDLPPGMSTGPATVQIDGPNSESYGPVDLNIIAGTGTPDPLRAAFAFGDVTLTPVFLAPLDRPAHFTLSFTGAQIPHAIEVTLTHDADSTVGGTGRALAINPRGEIKNLYWSDDGTSMQVILMRANDLVIDNIKDFKFYVAGGITNLQVDTVTAYDEFGAVIPGILASCTGCI